MKNCHPFIKVVFFLLVTLFVASCQKENVEPAPDLSIISSDDLEIVSSHENGWIKEAVKKGYRGATEASFEYHENGYIKYAKVYKQIPEHYLFSNFERNEDNLPLSAKYYYADGSIFMSIVYENGQISSKTLYTENDTKTVSRYQNGRVLTIEKSDGQNGQITKIEYDYPAQKRTLTIKSDSQLLHSEELSLSTDLGAGFSTNEDLVLSNFIPNQDFNEIRLSTSHSSSFGWERTVDPFTFIPATVVYDKWLQPRTAAIEVKLIANGDIYRSVTEQYPFAERRVLISGFQSVSKKFTISPEIATKEAIGDQLSDNLPEFTRLYGDEFNYEKFTGKYLLTVATLRNMPTDSKVSEQIEDIARKHASYLVSGDDFFTTSEEEKALLSKVFFELKVHSSSFNDDNGVVIKNYEDYETIVETLENADLDIIQRGFKKYSAVAIGN